MCRFIHTLAQVFSTLYKTEITLQNYLPFEIIKLRGSIVLMFLRKKSCKIAMSEFLLILLYLFIYFFFLLRYANPIQPLAHFFSTLYKAEIPKYIYNINRVTEYLSFEIIKLRHRKVGFLVFLCNKSVVIAI